MKVIVILKFCLVLCFLKHTIKTESVKSDLILPCANFTDQEELYVDCSYRNLTIIPRLPDNTIHLYLQHNFLMQIPDNTFENMTNLRTLDLSFNMLMLYTNKTFNGLRHLQTLKLGNNIISRIPNKTFGGMKKLIELDISYCHVSSINEQTFYGLNNLVHLALEKNGLYYNKKQLPKGSFQPLKSLKQLSIRNNNFGAINKIFPDETIADLILLEVLVLDVSCVDHNMQLFGKGFSSLQNLRTLNFSICDAVSLHNDTFKYTPHLTNVYISKCNILRIDGLGAFMKLGRLTVLELDIDITEGLMPAVHTFPWDKINNALYNTHIRELYCFKNIDVLVFPKQRSIRAPPNLRSLAFSNLGFSQILLNLTYVTTLKIDGNKLGNYLANNTYMMTKYNRLEFISLSNNSIFKLNSELFNDQPHLKVIDLSYNFLKHINFHLKHMIYLEMLNLANNSIVYLDDDSIANIDQILNENNNLKINLGGNPLNCGCSLLPYLKWMINVREHFVNFNQYKCVLENGSMPMSNSFEDLILHLQTDCMNYSYLIVGVSFTLFGFISLLIASLIYRHRWKLRYLFYTAKLRYAHQNNMDNRGQYVYDAFISYSDEIRTFVTKDCIDNLEQDGHFKLCIHHRDFLPGAAITDNITQAIQSSRKTICIITRSFIESDYCMFEYNMARMESIHRKKDKCLIFLVFYEQLQPEELPLVLYEIIQKKTYIEYPGDVHGNFIFWEKIKDAINA
ncbi:toll-like receptor 4 [Mytilus trossulus]|uniref:toll-like receptor 4 n=1 Tax=Mytilus trossulus TaxID=6551 RepID=UPI003006F694